MRYHKVVGIDLGTTYSAVSVWDYEKKEVVVIQTAVGDNTLPSVVGLDDEKKAIVGRPAQQRRVFDPKNTIIEVKRDMGVYMDKEQTVPKRVRFRDRDYLPQEISAFILSELKHQAEKFVGEEIHDAVITVPAYFKEPQRGATEDAASIARLNVKQLLNEPTAAAVCFGSEEDDGRQHIYAVYDLGGGTFDVSIIEVGGGNVNIVGTGGDPRLGGSDFDDEITKWAVEEIKRKHNVDLQRDETAKARIKQIAEVRKRELSATNSAVIDLPFLTSQLSVNLTITRTIFNGLIESWLQRSFKCMDDAFKSAEETAGVKKADIEQVLLVGGSSRIPRVRTMLAEYFTHLEEKDIRSDINPDEAVSRGAALVARKHNPSDAFAGKEIDLVATGAISIADQESAASIVLQDVTSHTLGILAYKRGSGDRSDPYFHRIIKKESRIPAEQTADGFVNQGPSNSVDVLIYQGESDAPFDNTLIGKLPIPLPEPREGGYWKFEVTFALDNDGLLSVVVKRLNDGQSFPLKVQCSVRSSTANLAESSALVAEVMANRESEPLAVPPPPPPPRKTEVQSTGTATGTAAAPISVDPPPDKTPEAFRRIARRSFMLLEQPMDPAKRARLAEAYTAFVAAVNQGTGNVDALGESLEDIYLESKS